MDPGHAGARRRAPATRKHRPTRCRRLGSHGAGQDNAGDEPADREADLGESCIYGDVLGLETG